MENDQTWVEALNINPETLNGWSAQAPAGTPLLVWCLEEGHVSVAEYLQWASDHFELPILSSAYFESGNLDRQFLELQKSQQNWSPWCFPVNEWEGVSYVACVEPPPERVDKVCYVLADPRVMREIWEVTGTRVSEISSVISSDAPAEEVDAPQGIVVAAEGTKSFHLNLNLDESALFRTSALPEDMPPAPLGDAADPQTSASISASHSILTSATTTSMDVEAADLSPPTALHRINVESKALELPEDEAAAIKGVFDHLKETYQHACILKWTPEGSAQLYKWDDSMVAVAASDGKPLINLSFPSFLRIIGKTGQPYHGFVVDSATHREFFGKLGLSGLPECVTAIPIKIDSKIWGAVLAIGDQSLQRLENLAQAEHAVEQLVEAMAPTWKKSA